MYCRGSLRKPPPLLSLGGLPHRRSISIIPTRLHNTPRPLLQHIGYRPTRTLGISFFRASFSSVKDEEKIEVSNYSQGEFEAPAQTIPEDVVPSLSESTRETIAEDQILAASTEVLKGAKETITFETVVVPSVTSTAAAATNADGPSSFFMFMLGENILRELHSFTGLPWWMVIGISTVTARLVTAPVFIYQMKNQAVMAKVKKEMEAILKSRPQQYDYTNKMAAMAAQQELLKQRLAKNNFHYWKLFVPFFFSAPIFLTMFMGVRNLCYNEPSMKEGGFGIFRDLTTSDSTWILPIIASIGTLLSIELSRYWNSADSMSPAIRNALRAFAALSVFIFSYMFKGVLVTVFFSGLMTILQNYILSRPKVKQFFGLPLNEKEQIAAGIAVAPTVLYTNKPKKKSTSA